MGINPQNTNANAQQRNAKRARLMEAAAAIEVGSKNTPYNPSGLEGGNKPSCQNAACQNTSRTIVTIARDVCQSPNCIEILLKYSQVAVAAVSELAFVA